MKKEITLNGLAELIIETRKDLTKVIEEKNNETRKDLTGLINETRKDLTKIIEEKNNETRNDLTGLINETRKSLEKKIDYSSEELATITQGQFLENQEYMDKKFKEVNTKVDNLDLEVKNHRVHIFTHKDLEHRVEKTEEKLEKHEITFHGVAKASA